MFAHPGKQQVPRLRLTIGEANPQAPLGMTALDDRLPYLAFSQVSQLRREKQTRGPSTSHLLSQSESNRFAQDDKSEGRLRMTNQRDRSGEFYLPESEYRNQVVFLLVHLAVDRAQDIGKIGAGDV